MPVTRRIQTEILEKSNALQRHFTENSKLKIPEMKLRGFVSISYIYESVSDLNIFPGSVLLQQNGGTDPGLGNVNRS
jgi:hypothetical protein